MSMKVENDLMQEISEEEIEGSIIGGANSGFLTITNNTRTRDCVIINTIDSSGVLDCFICYVC